MYSKKFNDDYQYGIDSEKEILQILNSKFDCNLKQTNKYDPYDFIDDDKKVIVELKTRRNTKNRYDSTIIGFHKIQKIMIKKDYKKILCFRFTDDLVYYRLDSINNNWVSRSGRKDRGILEFSQYYHIPTDKLISIKR